MSDSKSPGPPLVVPVLLASVLGIGGALVGGRSVIVPRPDAEMTRDLAGLARNLEGEVPALSAEGFEDVVAANWDHPVALAANECVVLLVAASESTFALELLDVPVDNPGLRSAHALSYCSAAEPEAAVFHAEFGRSPGRVLFHERRATVRGDVNLMTIAANWLAADYLAERLPGELRRRALEAKEAGTGDEPLVFEVEVSVERGALVHPMDDAMRRAIHEAAWLGIAERQPVDSRVQDLAGNTRGTQPASVRVGTTLEVLVAAVDARVYDHCVSLEVWPRQGTDSDLGVFLYPSGEVGPLIENTRHICPEDGVVLVYADTSDHDVLLRRSNPSESVGRRHESMGETLAFQQGVAACRSGVAARCIEVSDRYRIGNGVDQNVERAVEFAGAACELDASKCYEFALTEPSPRDHMLLTRACREGHHGLACLALGDRYRTGEGVPEDYAMARAAYLRACGIGGQCAPAQHLLDLELTTVEDTAAAASALGLSEAGDSEDAGEAMRALELSGADDSEVP